jgi:hypothetical protein
VLTITSQLYESSIYEVQLMVLMHAVRYFSGSPR